MPMSSNSVHFVGETVSEPTLTTESLQSILDALEAIDGQRMSEETGSEALPSRGTTAGHSAPFCRA